MKMGIEFDLLRVYTPEIIAPDESVKMYFWRVTTEKLIAANRKLMDLDLNLEKSPTQK